MSDQAVRLWQEGWFQGSAQPSGVSVLRNPKVCHALAQAFGTSAGLATGSPAAWRALMMRFRAYVALLARCLLCSARLSLRPCRPGIPYIGSAQAKSAASFSALSWHRLEAELESLVQEPKNERPVVVAGKDQGEVDNDYLLIPVNILDHEGPLSAAFPVENRLLPQGEQFESKP